jgi:L-fuconolactonase
MSKHIVDTHIHVWDLERTEYAWLKNDTSILNKTYSIEQLTPAIYKANVTSGILVQAANNFEDTDMMLEVAGRTDWIKGVVGWLPLIDPVATENQLIEKYLKNNYYTGCRHLIHNEVDAQWLLQENVIESLKVLAKYQLTYDIVGVNADHLQAAIKAAEKIPGLKMVFDHLNQPPIASKEKFGRWGELMKEASQHNNLFAKISGLGTTAGNGNNWTKDDLKPYVMHALELFGTDRCFCGGDWPVALLAGPYEKAWLAYQQIFTEELTLEKQEKLLYKNATSFYKLAQQL